MSTIKFGSELKKYRIRMGESITQVSKSIGIDRSYLSKIENEHEIPPARLLNLLFSHYSITKDEALRLTSILNFTGSRIGGLVMFHDFFGGKEANEKMEKRQPKVNPQLPNVQLGLAADKTPILYTDSVFINSNQYGIVFNVAQSIDNQNQQIVARIGMSRDHAAALAEVLAKHLAMTHSSEVKQ